MNFFIWLHKFEKIAPIWYNIYVVIHSTIKLVIKFDSNAYGRKEKIMKVYANMYKDIRKDAQAKRERKLQRKLTIFQKIKLAVINLQIKYAMKHEEQYLLVWDIEDRLVIELQKRGFKVSEISGGCASIASVWMFKISWPATS